MKIEVIIPNYNGADLVEKNLPSVLEAVSTYKDCLVTIVDDGSAEEEREKLRLVFEKIKKDSKAPLKLLENVKNVGFGSNVNRAALISKSDILILLNTDCSPEKDFLKSLLARFKDENVFGVGCMDKSMEEDGVVLRGRGIGVWQRGFVQHSRGEVDKEDTFWVSGGSSAIRTDLFQKLGGFDPLYDPFYWEDIDLSYRAQKAGYKLLFDKNSVVLHRHSVGSIKKHFKSNAIQKTAYRNQFTFVWKNISDVSLIASHLFWLPYHLLSAMSRTDTVFLNGFLLALVRIPAIILKRQSQKKFYKKKDKDIIFSK